MARELITSTKDSDTYRTTLNSGRVLIEVDTDESLYTFEADGVSQATISADEARELLLMGWPEPARAIMPVLNEAPASD